MNFVAIGRGEILYSTTRLLLEKGYELKSVITDTNAPEYRVKIEDFEKLARDHSVPFLQSSSKLVISEFLEQFEKLDIGISVNHRNILPAEVLGRFTHGVLNLHGGDLPRFKGNACQAWAIINGEERMGACVYKMEPNLLDTGKILSRRFLALSLNTKIQDCLTFLEVNGPSMFTESIKQLELNPNFYIVDSANEPVPSLRCHERRPEDGYINWNREPTEIVRLINASGDPYFGAYSFLEGELLKIVEAEPPKIVEQFLAVPGQVIYVCDAYVLVACAGGKSLLISTVDFGGKRLNASTVLKSTRMRLGPKENQLN